jgi:hypothetical protein
VQIVRRHAHSQRLERWLGVETVENLSRNMQGWYGPPILVSNVPGGGVWAARGGDFVGSIAAGGFASAMDYYTDRANARVRAWARRELSTCHMGFASFTDFAKKYEIRRQELQFRKTVPTNGANNVTSDLWYSSTYPAAGGNAAAAPGGTVPTSSTTGAMKQRDAMSGETQHLAGSVVTSDLAGGYSILLYDRLFAVTKTMSSTATEAVTGVPTRYQNTTAGTSDSAEGNFLFPVATSTLGAGAHNWTVCQYTNQAGTAGRSVPSFAGLSGNFAGYTEFNSTGLFFAGLAAGDSGIKALTQMQCDASITGSVDFVVGHPLAFIPCAVAGALNVIDGVRRAFNMVRIFDGAALTFISLPALSTSSATFTGNLTTVCG